MSYFIPIAYLYYFLGASAVFFGMSAGAGYYLLFGVISASLLTNTWMAKNLYSAGMWWYVYFAALDFLIGAWLLFGFRAEMFKLAGLVCLAMGAITTLCRVLERGSFIDRWYLPMIAVANACFFIFLASAVFMGKPLGIR